MSKTKSASKAAKPSKSDVLTKVKDAGVVKPSKDGKTKSKVIAKEVAAKEEKKSKKDKKKVKEPTPEPSSAESESESEESASSESESSESEAEVQPKKAVNGKATKAAKPAESDSDSSDSDSSEDEAPAPKKGHKKVNGVAAAKKEDSSDDSSDDSESDEEVAPVNGVLGKAPAVDDASDSDESDSSEDEAPAKANGAKNEDASDSSDSSDSSSDDDEEDTPAVKTNKRKADDEAETTTKKPKTESTGNKNLFVGNLSWNVTEDWLREEFEVYGELSGARLMTDRDSGRSKGFGYVEYVNAEDAQKAYDAKKDTELDNRTINLDWASVRTENKDKSADRRKSYGDQLSEPSDTLFVGNLSFDVGQEEVSEAFAPFGTISSVRLPTDMQTGMAKGFGYVTFESVDEAKAALESMQGGYIGSRPVRLDYSQPRPPREDGGRGGRGGGGRGFGGRGRGGDRGRGGFGGRGRGGDRGGRGGRGGSTNRGGFGDFKGKRQTFD